MDRTTPLHVTNHYRRNISEYDEIRGRLNRTRQTFLNADRSEQIEMLQKSHSFAVISVQTPVHIHEAAFTELWDGEPLDNIEAALESVNYRNNKERYIRHSIENEEMWGGVADMLEAGEVPDAAHKYVLENFKGVGPAKAPFTFAMLGFTEKACIDANVVNAMGLDEHVSTVVVEKYDAIVESLRDKMPTLKQETSPFVWQWIVFSFQRHGVSGKPDTHDVWFRNIGIID